jgi:hypothetical protein
MLSTLSTLSMLHRPSPLNQFQYLRRQMWKHRLACSNSPTLQGKEPQTRAVQVKREAARQVSIKEATRMPCIPCIKGAPTSMPKAKLTPAWV